MIVDDDELAVVRKQLALIEHALDDLRQNVLPKNKRNFEIFSEAYVDQIAELKAEIDNYRTTRRKQAAAKSNGSTQSKRKASRKRQKT